MEVLSSRSSYNSGSCKRRGERVWRFIIADQVKIVWLQTRGRQVRVGERGGFGGVEERKDTREGTLF